MDFGLIFEVILEAFWSLFWLNFGVDFRIDFCIEKNAPGCEEHFDPARCAGLGWRILGGSSLMSNTLRPDC